MNENENEKVNEKVNENKNEIENENVNVSLNLFDVMFGPPRTGGRLKSMMCEPAGQYPNMSARMGSDSHVGAGRGRTLERGTLPGQAGTRRDIRKRL
ncbi:hypothetical protein F2Q70_00002850 [Brassica cretica]|uniref:Uncharacterized protein n=1 Tax=Brassica cretica TaxID=69181 RepID=A0A8S9IM13_BRACR|nr:hypothetical protein F2Q70_00002850 [Brassica cretica]